MSDTKPIDLAALLAAAPPGWHVEVCEDAGGRVVLVRLSPPDARTWDVMRVGRVGGGPLVAARDPPDADRPATHGT